MKRLSAIQGVCLEYFYCIRSKAVKLGHTVWWLSPNSGYGKFWGLFAFFSP